MALIKCPDCGKEISDKAKNCIHCGCPIEESKSSTNEKETNKVEEKEVIPADTNKTENKKRIGKTLLIVAVMAIFLIGVFKSIPNKGEKIELPVALEGEAGLKEITYDEYKEKIKLKKPLLVTVINSEDKYSEDYLSLVKKILNIYRIPINYIDISKIDDKDINIFLNSNKSFSVQPSTTLMSGRKELNSIKGVIEKEELINFIKENIIVEEDTRTPQEKIVDYIKDKKTYNISSCNTDVCNYSVTTYGVRSTDYYKIDFANKKYSLTTYSNGSTYYEYNYGSDTGYIKNVDNIGWTTTIEINITFDEDGENYNMEYTSSGYRNLDISSLVKTLSKIVASDLKDDIINMCNELEINISDL